MAWDDEVAEAMAQVFDKEAGVGTSVTFRRVTQGAFTASTGVRATTNADTVVAALRGPAVTRIADQSGRMVETRHYSILASELSGITPKADDQIVDSGVVYRVTTVGRASEAACWELECSRSGA